MLYFRKLVIAIVVLFVSFPISSAWAQSQSDFSFDDGVVALYCSAKEGSEIPDDVFEEAFPQWIEALQSFADDGVISRAHYLPDFRSGVFVVVGGESLDNAKSNVLAVEKSMLAILESALTKAGSANPYNDTCQQIEIGPVAILPKQ